MLGALKNSIFSFMFPCLLVGILLGPRCGAWGLAMAYFLLGDFVYSAAITVNLVCIVRLVFRSISRPYNPIAAAVDGRE